MSSLEDQRTLAPQPPAKKGKSKTRTLALRRSAATGPQTQRGKMKSRYNALKHGVFAKVVLRGSTLRESEQHYKNLLESFRESYCPQGGVEEFLVEKLAQLAWRKARLVRAETAIIMKQTEFLREDRESRLKEASEGHSLSLAELAGGVARRRENPYLLRKAIDLLEMLKGAIEVRGFELETDERVLQSLYGEQGHREGLFLTYRAVSSLAKEQSDQSSQGNERQYRKRFLSAIEVELRNLENQIADLEAREKRELPLAEEALAIPSNEELDRLLRYEARLDGSFDRTLQQLERLQRMRQGQPVPPTLKVDLSRE